MQEENFEYLKLHVRHPRSWGESGSEKEAALITRSRQDDEHIEHASLQGWKIRATSVFDTDSGHLEIIHMQRSSFHPNFSQKTFTDRYWEQMSKERKRGKKVLLDKNDDE